MKKVTKPVLTGRPKKNDKADVRCAFVNDRPGKHDLGKKPDQVWCHGCQFYVCEECDSPFGVDGLNHDVGEHSPGDDE